MCAVAEATSGEQSVTKGQVAEAFAGIAASYGSGLPFFEVFGRDLIEAAAIVPGERVLDLACGRGACLRPAAEAVGASGFVLGVDLSPAMIELTDKELVRDGIANARVEVGDAEHLNLDGESFDAVTCGFAVFMFPALAQALSECRRVLKDGGRFAASTFADGMLDYPWLPELLSDFGLMAPMKPMLGADALTEALLATGFDRVQSTRSERRFVFTDLDSYLSWVDAHAFGAFVRRLDPADVTRFRDQCDAHLAEDEGPEGYVLVKKVDLTIAHQTS
jgi:ubiquinone/menaquinone biosynthesis C-methylase UbiE